MPLPSGNSPDRTAAQTVDLINATEEQLNALEAIFGPLASAGGDDEGYPGGKGEESGNP